MGAKSFSGVKWLVVSICDFRVVPEACHMNCISSDMFSECHFLHLCRHGVVLLWHPHGHRVWIKDSTNMLPGIWYTRFFHPETAGGFVLLALLLYRNKMEHLWLHTTGLIDWLMDGWMDGLIDWLIDWVLWIFRRNAARSSYMFACHDFLYCIMTS